MAGTSVEHNLNLSLDLDWKKRKAEDDIFPEVKRPRQWYYRLESESSIQSEEDTESVYSIQDKETDLARDTSDTDSKSDSDSADFEVEYEVASLSENEEMYPINSSSGDEDFIEGAIAAAICETSLDAWLTDVETSDSSSMDEWDFLCRSEFGRCVQCKALNDNPAYRYCEKCYQVRKKMFPPRPRARSRRRSKENKKPKVQLDALQSCLNGLSQDSGLGSSQEFKELDFKEIVVPEHLKSNLNDNLNETLAGKRSDDDKAPTTSKEVFQAQVIANKKVEDVKGKDHTNKRKREEDEEDTGPSTSTSNTEMIKKRKMHSSDELLQSPTRRKNLECNRKSKTTELEKVDLDTLTGDCLVNKGMCNSQKNTEKAEDSDSKELCIICNCLPKNGIFLHGSSAHMCCCYECAKKTWRTSKRCPICKRKVNNIVKLFN